MESSSSCQPRIWVKGCHSTSVAMGPILMGRSDARTTEGPPGRGLSATSCAVWLVLLDVAAGERGAPQLGVLVGRVAGVVAVGARAEEDHVVSARGPFAVVLHVDGERRRGVLAANLLEAAEAHEGVAVAVGERAD